ncbi:putative DNA-binding ribbon-helix-helix protein [Algoriphagus sp. 4150]|nr:putative DNA-binding ribbon-helix-helix protein [Algoriphagus sp. 4150]
MTESDVEIKLGHPEHLRDESLEIEGSSTPLGLTQHLHAFLNSVNGSEVEAFYALIKPISTSRHSEANCSM